MDRRFSSNSETYLLTLIERAVSTATICLGPRTARNRPDYMIQLMYPDGSCQTFHEPTRRAALERAAGACEDRIWIAAGVTGDEPGIEREAA